MKTTLLLILSFLSLGIHAQSSRQAVTKVVEWNLDGLSPTSLPFNQYIKFKVTSKKEDLSNIVHVLIFEHKGSRTARQSYESYNHPSKHFFGIDEVTFRKDSNILEVYMRKRDDEETDEKRVLQPAKLYTFFFIGTGALQKLQKTLLKQTYAYVEAKNAGVAQDSVDKLKDKVKGTHEKLQRQAEDNRKIVPFFTAQEKDFLEYLKWYDTFYPFEEDIDAAQKKLDSAIASLAISGANFRDSVVDFILQLLNLSDSKKDKSAKSICIENNCQLYRALLGLYQADTTSLRQLVRGERLLADQLNPLYKPDGKTLAVRIDTTLVTLERIELFLQTTLDHNLIPQQPSPPQYSPSRYFPVAMHSQIQEYLTKIHRLKDYLKNTRPLVVEIEAAQAARDLYLRNSLPFLAFLMGGADTYIYNIETRNNLLIRPIFSYSLYGFQKDFTSFTSLTGLHFNFQPLDEAVPFRLLRHKTLWQRLGFETGITIASFKETDKRENLFGNSTSLFTGLGFKLSHYVMLSGGAIWFKKDNPNPFLTDKKVALTPYAAISLDLNLRKIFEGLTSLVPLK